MNVSTIKEVGRCIWRLEAVIETALEAKGDTYARASGLWNSGLEEREIDALREKMDNACRALVLEALRGKRAEILAELDRLGNPLTEEDVQQLENTLWAKLLTKKSSSASSNITATTVTMN